MPVLPDYREFITLEMNIFNQEGNLRPAGSVEVQEGNLRPAGSVEVQEGNREPLVRRPAGSVEVHFRGKICIAAFYLQ